MPDATVQFDVKDDLGRAVRVPFGLVFKRIGALDPAIPFHVPQEHYYQPANDELLPSGLHRVEIALPKVSHREDADGKLHWTLQNMQRWPLANAQRVRIVPGANRLAVQLPARLRPIRVQVYMPACVDRAISVYAIGAIPGQAETWPMGSFEPDRGVGPGGVCQLRFAALPGHALLHAIEHRRRLTLACPRMPGWRVARLPVFAEWDWPLACKKIIHGLFFNW